MDCSLSPSELDRHTLENEKVWGFVYELMVCMHVSVLCFMYLREIEAGGERGREH